MSVLKGDFLGFTFNGVHSSELGIFRVSDGSRYTENLLPTIQDKTTQFPGADGMYYYGSYYTQRQINFPIAFDELTDAQLRRIKVLFSDKKPHDLIFDEAPYKVYKVKPTGTPNLKYVSFDRPKEPYDRDYLEQGACATERIYKGEGQLSFTAYSPFARSRFKYLDEYTFENIPEWGMQDLGDQVIVNNNIDEWKESSHLIKKVSKKLVDWEDVTYTLDIVGPYGVLCYNAGDLDTPFSLNLYFEGNSQKAKDGITLAKKTGAAPTDSNEKLFNIGGFTLFDGDAGIRINSSLHLIEGINDKGKSTGTLYNQYIIGGDFFKFAPSEDIFLLQISWNGDGTTSNTTKTSTKDEIIYDYLYY